MAIEVVSGVASRSEVDIEGRIGVDEVIGKEVEKIDVLARLDEGDIEDVIGKNEVLICTKEVEFTFKSTEYNSKVNKRGMDSVLWEKGPDFGVCF